MVHVVSADKEALAQRYFLISQFPRVIPGVCPQPLMEAENECQWEMWDGMMREMMSGSQWLE